MSNEYNEDAYRDARKSINPTPCAFEKAVLARCVSCELADKHLLAERETINCHEAAAQKTCNELRKALRSHAAFTLKISSLNAPVPHGKEIKAQCGGLKGLQNALTGSEDVPNARKLVLDALEKFGDLEALPYSVIVQTVANFNIRRRN
jgi:HEAT repeat protein